MKKILFTLGILLLLVSVTSAQWGNNAVTLKNTQTGWVKYFSGDADSVGGTYATMYSNDFSIEDFDGCDSLEYSFKLGSALGSPKLTIDLIGSDYTTTTTSMVVLNNIVTGSTSEVENFGSVKLNGKRARHMALKITAVALGRPDQTFTVYLKLPKRDF